MQNNFRNVALQTATPQAAPPSNTQEELLLKQQTGLNQELVNSLKFYEAHWQGADIMDLTAELKQQLNYPMDLVGLIIGEVTLNSLVSGMMGGDVILAVDGMRVENLRQFKDATQVIKGNTSAKVKVWRSGKEMTFEVKASDGLGFAQVESAPMIKPGEARPHPHRGACTDCHLVRAVINAEIQPDPDDVILQPLPITAGAKNPHEDRGPCQACHVIK
ncbi:MAG: PDZ domain-containing protein [Candidatus Riflebacteria bacterium]|nr:PDZ domain-containing protein [Candidatus Riflebacteria bacterium]